MTNVGQLASSRLLLPPDHSSAGKFTFLVSEDTCTWPRPLRNHKWLRTSAAPFHERAASSSSPRAPAWLRTPAQRSCTCASASARHDCATGCTFCRAWDRNWKWTCITVRKQRPSTWGEERKKEKEKKTAQCLTFSITRVWDQIPGGQESHCSCVAPLFMDQIPNEIKPPSKMKRLGITSKVCIECVKWITVLSVEWFSQGKDQIK